ncbi:MAG: phosphoribosylamine--glycine ligase [Clostridia bacterium]
MKLLIIGSGGREHAILDACLKSEQVTEAFVCPGNPGMNATQVNLDVTQIEEIADFAEKNVIDLTIVGPEVPLVMGISDLFTAKGLRVIGVDKDCARFEGSKDFTKEFLMKYKIPTAEYVTHTDFDAACKDIGIYGYPMVIKADGLAAGKGVIIAQNSDEAHKALDDIMVKKVFGESTVVIEEFLDGIEASIICLVDGKTIVPLETAQDYKKAYDDDMGPNTGGMGTYSPSYVMNDELVERIDSTILQPVMQGFIDDGLNYKGILFIGIMIKNNIPKVLEFNVRFGDPETQVILPRLKSDIIDVFGAVIDGKLADTKLEWSEDKTVCVVLASGGYPDAYAKEIPITIENDDTVKVYHAGTKTLNGQLVTNGGRVLNVVSINEDIDVARKNVYNNIDKVNFDGKMFRKDIAIKKV